MRVIIDDVDFYLKGLVLRWVMASVERQTSQSSCALHLDTRFALN